MYSWCYHLTIQPYSSVVIAVVFPRTISFETRFQKKTAARKKWWIGSVRSCIGISERVDTQIYLFLISLTINLIWRHEIEMNRCTARYRPISNALATAYYRMNIFCFLNLLFVKCMITLYVPVYCARAMSSGLARSPRKFEKIENIPATLFGKIQFLIKKTPAR